MEIRYHKKGPDPHYLYVAVYDREGDALIATGEKISGKDWRAHRYPVKAQAVMTDVLKVRRLLEAQEEDVTPITVKRAYELRKEESVESLQRREKTRKKESQVLIHMLNDWTANHIFRFRPSTQKIIRHSISVFKEFLSEAGHPGLERKELNNELIAKYERYLQEKRKLSNSTHGARMKHLRWFLKHIEFDVSKIKLRRFQRQIISLDLTELRALEKVNVSRDKDHQKAKDIFLLGCYTGQRISDLKKIKKESIVNNEIHIRQTKTGKDVQIPLIPEIQSILARYNGAAPKITEQDLNTNIKLVCKLAGINTPINFEYNKAGLNVQTVKPKHELVSSHIAGKTFISTVATELMKMNAQEIASITGKNLKTLLSHYFQLPRESAKSKMVEYGKSRLKTA